jgi:hypothetical protein
MVSVKAGEYKQEQDTLVETIMKYPSFYHPIRVCVYTQTSALLLIIWNY